MAEEPRTEAQMRKSAELVVDVCFAVKEDDVVTIITDDRRKDEAEMVAAPRADRIRLWLEPGSAETSRSVRPCSRVSWRRADESTSWPDSSATTSSG